MFLTLTTTDGEWLYHASTPLMTFGWIVLIGITLFLFTSGMCHKDKAGTGDLCSYKGGCFLFWCSPWCPRGFLTTLVAVGVDLFCLLPAWLCKKACGARNASSMERR